MDFILSDVEFCGEIYFKFDTLKIFMMHIYICFVWKGEYLGLKFEPIGRALSNKARQDFSPPRRDYLYT